MSTLSIYTATSPNGDSVQDVKLCVVKDSVQDVKLRVVKDSVQDVKLRVVKK